MGFCWSAHLLAKVCDVPLRRDDGQNGITSRVTDLPTVAPTKYRIEGLVPFRYLITSEEAARELSYSVIRHLEPSGASHYMG
ncbi:uncharacterized protein FPOAC1_013426 [Fusarium poae]|uniref:uncharacterized protein n=1 Tax=Fusarium poae TaxID=36050 RepID=UPI001D0590F7|nr:uncharacterized protein FPOAC1_013426 [Fusarium poae]KAG8664646.1 hypothetical protein FPOAC1_013426 [Fusarium poae]